MNRNLLFVLFFPFAVTQSDSLPSILCLFPENSIILDYELRINDIPKRCQVFIIHGTFNDDIIMDDTKKDFIENLKKAEKNVYILPMFENKSIWDLIFNSDLNTHKENQETLMKFMKDYKINGVVIDSVAINEPNSPDSELMVQFINKLKTDIPSFTVCAFVTNDESASQTSVFDLSELDLYIIDKDTFPESSNMVDNYPLISTSKIIQNLNLYSIDLKKVIIHFVISTFDDNKREEISLSKYCKQFDVNDPKLSTVPLQLYYNEVTSAISKINGILIGYLDNDDYDNICECGKFPVTNTIIAACYSESFKTCKKIP